MGKLKNKKYYIIDNVAKENGNDDYFLFNYFMAINGCKYVNFNECTLYPTYEKAQEICDEYNKYFKKGIIMTLKQLNDTITGFPERCYMIYSDTTYSKKIREIWTEVSNGRGGYYEKWDDDPIINREVAAFQSSGWRSNVYDVVLK